MPATAAKVKRSVLFTAKSKDDNNRVAAIEPATPIASPTPANAMASRRIIEITLRAQAPSAMRIPISCRRAATLYDMTP